MSSEASKEAAVEKEDLDSCSDAPERFGRLFVERLKAMQGRTTNREFAARLSTLLGRNIHEARISEWRSGRHLPSAAVYLAIAEASEESVDDVLFEGTVGPALHRLRAQLEEHELDRDDLETRLNRLGAQMRELLELNRRLLSDRGAISLIQGIQVHATPPGSESEPEPPGG